MNYIDITPEISPKTAVFPGDVPFSREVHLDFEKEDHLTLSSIRSTLHVGAHADAPNHYNPNGCDIASRSLNYYMGDCQVIQVSVNPGGRIKPHHIESIAIETPRVLFRTNSFPNPETWEPNFQSLSPELVHCLADQGVILVGIDTPSVDPETSKVLESHQAIYQRDLAILEGLWLGEATPGRYHLVALPLKIAGADASPVRAVLLPRVI